MVVNIVKAEKRSKSGFHWAHLHEMFTAEIKISYIVISLSICATLVD